MPGTLRNGPSWCLYRAQSAAVHGAPGQHWFVKGGPVRVAALPQIPEDRLEDVSDAMPQTARGVQRRAIYLGPMCKLRRAHDTSVQEDAGLRCLPRL
jgi:hypothetical protein